MRIHAIIRGDLTESNTMRDLNDVQYFAAVVENQGFSAAARTLNLPKSSVSRRIANLEARLGVRLIERSTRSLRLTEVGVSFLRALQCDSCRSRCGRARGRCPTRGTGRPRPD